MKNLKQLLILLCVVQFFASCNSSLYVAKRHYNGGYYVDLSVGNKKSVKQDAGKDDKTKSSEITRVTPKATQQIETERKEYDASLLAYAGNDSRSAKSHKTFKAIKHNSKSEETINYDESRWKGSVTENLNAAPVSSSEGKSQIVAALLCFFVGVIGIHRFYLGYTWQGIVQILTLGGLGIWTLIDFIRILTGDLKPKDGAYDKTL